MAVCLTRTTCSRYYIGELALRPVNVLIQKTTADVFFLGNRQNQRFRSCVSICHILRKTVKLSEISDALFYWYLSVFLLLFLNTKNCPCPVRPLILSSWNSYYRALITQTSFLPMIDHSLFDVAYVVFDSGHPSLGVLLSHDDWYFKIATHFKIATVT